MGKTDTAPAPQGGLLVRAEAMGAGVAAIIDSIPDAGNDGELGILMQVFAARTADDLAAPWETQGFHELTGRKLRITGIRKAPSDFPDGFGFFLLVDCEVVETGQRVVVTTGASAVVAQLIKAFSLGAFPWTVIPRVAERPSANGYYPQHLEPVRQVATSTGGGTH